VSPPNWTTLQQLLSSTEWDEDDCFFERVDIEEFHDLDRRFSSNDPIYGKYAKR
jgi:hypothetical protein